MIVEIASSTVSIDLHTKKEVYRRHGVQEYLVWAVLDQKILWFALKEGHYEPLQADAEGILRSAVFPGLWLASRELLAGNLAAVLHCALQGSASAEQKAFVDKIRG